MQTLDCRGLACPGPVLRTKEVVDSGIHNIVILVDNEAAKENVSRFLINQGHLPEESLFHDIFQKLLALSAKPLDDGQSAFQDQKELMAGVSLIDNDLSNAKMSDPTLQANWGKVKISLRY